MARRIIEYPSEGAANAAQHVIHVWMGNNVAGYNAQRWSVARAHPTESGRWAITVKARCRNGIPANDRDREKDAEADWEPEEGP